MCGIAGIVNFNGVPVEVAMLQRMNQAIAHRGPDGEGLWVKNQVGFGHRRLAIRDLSTMGHQPMLDQSGMVCVTYNGEIYNYPFLRNLLEEETGYRFQSTCDTELLPIGWLTWGEKLFERLEGMFAIAIWDSRNETLILARDPIGIKPLFYIENHSSVVFCSEIKGIIATNAVPLTIDPAAFHTYLAAGYTDPNASLVQNIRQVLPGTTLTYSHEQTHKIVSNSYPYWQPTRQPQITDIYEASDRVQSLLREITDEMLVADVPIGLLQSGGIDSTLIACSIKTPLQCFTAAFNEASHDEKYLAQQIAKFAHHPWQSFVVEQQQGLVEDFYKVAHHVDGQLADSSCLAHFALCREVRKTATVVLAGDGADEIFAGYSTYTASRIANIIAPFMSVRLVMMMGNVLFKVYGKDEKRLPWHEQLRRFLWGMAAVKSIQHPEWRRLTPPSLLAKMYGTPLKPFLKLDPLHYYRQAVLNAKGSLLDRCLLADQTVYLPGDMLTKVDRMSMAHGLEIRVPFMDRRMIDLASQLDGNLLSPLKGPPKRILRHILKSLALPSQITNGKKKGFNIPLARLLRHELKSVGEKLIMQNADLYSPLLKADGIRQLWQEHREGQRNHAYTLWALLIYGAWRQNI